MKIFRERIEILDKFIGVRKLDRKIEKEKRID